MPKTRTLASLIWFCCLLAGTASAHGGQYRGPTEKPGGRSVGPSAPNPGVPPGPTTPGSAGLHAVLPDVTRWQVWWELNKDPYLRAPRIALDPTRPENPRRIIPRKLKVDVILPELRKALGETSNQHISTACMIAMAKIGLDHPDFKILDQFRPRLRRGNQEVREAAALAMGISKQPAALPDLIALFENLPAGRRATGRDSVDDRTRAFAGYALGLLARGNEDIAVKQAVFDSLRKVLLDDQEKSRDIKIAALNGMRLLDPRPECGAGHRRLLWAAAECLQDYQRRRFSKSRQTVQAHVAPALARLLGRGGGPDRERAKKLLAEVFAPSRNHHDTVYQSAMIAFGQLMLPVESDPAEAAHDMRMQNFLTRNRDQLTGHLGLIAMGRIGGMTNMKRLIHALKHGKRIEQGWAALALGLCAFHAPKPPPDPRAQTRVADPVRGPVGDALYKALLSVSNRDVRAAAALGLGLCGHLKAAPTLRKLLEKYQQDPDFAGYVAMGLALMDDKAAGQLIEQVMSSAARKPILMAQSALALARLEHPGASVTLRSILRTGGVFRTMVLASTSAAMGYLADPQNVDPLCRILADRSNNNLVRAFAAVALGSMAENDPLTWSAWIAMNVNYSATVETLTDGSAGILDIL